MARHKRSTPVDHGYSWVILVASFFAHTIQYGIAWTVGVFFDIFRVEFEGSTGAIALISSLNTFTFFMAGPFAGTLTNKFGYRPVAMSGGLIGSIGLMSSRWATEVWHLYLTYGVIGGFGLGIAYIPSITIVGHYFEKRRMLALGIAVSGCGFGTFIFPPIIRLFVEHYGWRGGILLTGALCLNTCVCGALMRHPVSAKAASDENKNEAKDAAPAARSVFNLFIFKNRDYLTLCVNNTLFSFGLSVVYVHLSAFGETMGCSKDKGAMLFSVIGISNCVGRVLFGVLANMRLAGPLCWYMLGLLLCGVTTTMIPLSYNYPGLIACAASFGLFSACIGPLLPQIQVDFLGVAMLNSAYGYLLVFEAIGHLLGAPVAGWLYDKSTYYAPSFYLSGLTVILSSIFMIYPWYRSRNKGLPLPCDDDIEVKVGGAWKER